MKKLSIIFVLGTVALASCSSDDLVVNTNVEETPTSPIGFAVSTGNMTRATGEATQLSKEHWDFGVWAYKSNGDKKEVMSNYLVGYWDKKNSLGYYPNNSQLLEGTSSEYYWYYDGLGYEESKDLWTDKDGVAQTKPYFTFKPGSSGRTAATSANQYQYLKYWDKAGGYTMFYAYAPYRLNVTFDNTTMTFPPISSISDNGNNAMYAVKKVTNPTGTTNQWVNLQFERLLAQVRLAFYEVVAGYNVELIDYSSTVSIPNDDKWKGFGTSAMFAVPAEKDGATYKACEYVTSAAPVITFSDETASVNYNGTKTGTNLNIPLWFHKPSGTQTNVLGTTREKAIMNDFKDVLPQEAASACGFTVNLSLKFTALDTEEEILVKGVRVHIPAADCQWAANTRYTYYFKVTKAVPGQPDDPGTPSVIPGTDPYLLPIVFDDVKVEGITDWDNSTAPYDVN